LEHHHYILHKPYGYLSQFINNKRRKKKLLSDLYDFVDGTMAVGRLDVKSEGLLFLTTDGKLSEEIRSKKVEKEYYVQVHGFPSEESLEKLRSGIRIMIEGKPHTTLTSVVERIEFPEHLPLELRKVRDEKHGPMSWLSITIREGKFRQVRKMTAAIGHPTQRLIRYRIGGEKLDGISFGEVRKVERLQLV